MHWEKIEVVPYLVALELEGLVAGLLELDSLRQGLLRADDLFNLSHPLSNYSLRLGPKQRPLFTAWSSSLALLLEPPGHRAGGEKLHIKEKGESPKLATMG